MFFCFSFLLQFVFILLLILEENDAFLISKSKTNLSDYVIDLIFANSLTIIRCNKYELQILRSVSMETIGNIRCSNSFEFLPNDQLEKITLLRWNSTIVQCKKLSLLNEKTLLDIVHKPKMAFHKLSFQVMRVDSTDRSGIHWEEKKNRVTFTHSLRSIKNKFENETVEIFAFPHRPILCREQHDSSSTICDPKYQPKNFTYICYYQVDSMGTRILHFLSLSRFILQFETKE